MSDIKAPEVKTPPHLGTGRRKTAVARVRLAAGTGKIVINGRPFENYFPMETLRGVATQPLTVTGSADKFDAQITVSGGGPTGQAGAVRHGLARALLTVDINLRPAPESRRPADPRSAHEGAEEVRPAGRAQTLPIQQTLNRLRRACRGISFPTPLVESGGVLFCKDEPSKSCHRGRLGLFRRRTGAPAAVASARGTGRRHLPPIRRPDAGAVFPKFAHHPRARTLRFSEPKAELLAKQAQIVFLALPHGVAAEFAVPLLQLGCQVIDLSADFRVKSAAVYKDFYAHDHPRRSCWPRRFTACRRSIAAQIKKASLIAPPGCYPTSILLPTCRC